MDPKAEEAIHRERHIRIVCIGAGASGLCLAYKLQRSFRNFTLAVSLIVNLRCGYAQFCTGMTECVDIRQEFRYCRDLAREQVPRVSFVFTNQAGKFHFRSDTRFRCACDVPAHNYTYSFDPKPDWTSMYASSQQIKEYFKGFGKKYDLMKYIKTRHRIIEARWQDRESLWTVKVEDLESGQSFEDQCDVLINAGGYLNNLKWPSVPGLQVYKGQLVHSADWADGLNLNGKKVGLIGNGWASNPVLMATAYSNANCKRSSAVQILPQIQPQVDSLTMFFRTPLWILPTISGGQRQYTQQEINELAINPKALMLLRKRNETVMNSIFSRSTQLIVS